MNNHKYKENDKKILIEFQDYCYEKLGIKICTKSKDFLNLQLYIYNDIENMLLEIFNKVNSISNDSLQKDINKMKL